MSSLAWPLQHNQIRRDIRNNAFGMVRNGGTRAHQGWDMVAVPLTPCYAIADGTIIFKGVQGGMAECWCWSSSIAGKRCTRRIAI